MAVPTRPVSGAPIETAWGDIVHDGVVAQDIQSGKASAVFSNASAVAVDIVFPRAYASPPVVVATPELVSTSASCSVGNITTSGCRLRPFVTGSAMTGTVPVHWVAIGPRA